MFSTDDTIVAVATPPGRGGLGVVRLAGPEAAGIAATLVRRRKPFEPRHATLVRIVEPVDDRVTAAVDQVVVTWFRAPHSYTGDDVVEISGHGSPVLLRRIVELSIAAGARLAGPGEFTLRAYLNGRLDLVQAEAVVDLVDAVTPLQARSAMDQLDGTLTEAIGAIHATLFDVAAKLEASLDFPEEGFHFISAPEVSRLIGDVLGQLLRLSAEGRLGRVLREGRTVVIAGLPNAGKSTLFNALVGAERAIVTDAPGTTRDVLTERVEMSGVPITLVDTAGLRDGTDAIEAEGVARARRAQDVAALRLVLIDGSVAPTDDVRALLARVTTPRLIVLTKADLPRACAAEDLASGGEDAICVSTVSGDGMAALRRRIVSTLTDHDDLRDPPAISNVRHLGLVDDAAVALGRALEQVEAGATEELILTEIAAARASLEELTGRRTPDDMLEHIFSRFCVGK